MDQRDIIDHGYSLKSKAKMKSKLIQNFSVKIKDALHSLQATVQIHVNNCPTFETIVTLMDWWV